MKKVILTLTVMSLLALTACTKVQTVEYYKENPDKAQATMIKCENKKQKGEMNEKELENCSNAIQAYMSKQLSSIFQ